MFYLYIVCPWCPPAAAVDDGCLQTIDTFPLQLRNMMKIQPLSVIFELAYFGLVWTQDLYRLFALSAFMYIYFLLIYIELRTMFVT